MNLCFFDKIKSDTSNNYTVFLFQKMRTNKKAGNWGLGLTSYTYIYFFITDFCQMDAEAENIWKKN